LDGDGTISLMLSPRAISFAVLAAGVAAGTAADRPHAHAPIEIGGYRVLAADFHTHSSTWSDGALTPWGLVLEAERQGLDAIAITGHNQISDAQLGRWFSRHIGGPTVFVGQEILAPHHHVIAVGIDRLVDWRLSVADQIDDVHRQGGIAIAAHPLLSFWPSFDQAAMQRLDGAEICHPLVFVLETGQRDLERFAARGSVAAIGSSDYHGPGPMGLCRTYVFASDASESGILDAVRAHRTVVFGAHGQAYGDPALVTLAMNDGRLRRAPAPTSRWLNLASQILGVLGMVGVIVGGDRRVRSG
jgi:PHP-associated